MDAFDAAAAATIGVNRNDLRALNLLETGPLSQASIAAALKITRPSVTTLVDRLESAGMVRRVPDLRDRRSTLVELLPATWQAFERVYRPVGTHVDQLADGWDEQQRQAVAQALLDLSSIFDVAVTRIMRDPAEQDASHPT
ncbi:MarR family winged helix-turn-helix transcriptional regulator [Ornithinimicrobium sp. LYQ121]|uniref:MarR family winged helix-turn-helix transcriptional regulator n=1 Tax=Ornithinimicrobium sp. LYQ121 TaxID=3378801 RepID=UPI003854E522